MLLTRFEYPCALGRVEHEVLAEDVTESGEPGRGGNHLVGDESGVVGLVPALRNRVRTEKRRDHGRQPGLAQLPRHPQHLQLGLGVKAVAGLHLHRGRAPLAHLAQPGQSTLVQLVFGGSSGSLHGREDASAGLGDFLVG